MEKTKTTVVHKLLTIIGIVLCIILIPILVINCILIVKSFTSEDVPSVAGTFPLIVLTDSMYPQIQSGDLIICHTADAEDISEGDVIAFFDPAGSGTTVVTHRVTQVLREEGSLSFQTKGDNNNVEDNLPVPAKNLVGVYRTRIPGVGNIALFMQSTTGLIVCVLLPILLMVIYDTIRRRVYEKHKKEDTAALMAELEMLRAIKAEKEKQS